MNRNDRLKRMLAELARQMAARTPLSESDARDVLGLNPKTPPPQPPPKPGTDRPGDGSRSAHCMTF